MIKRFISTFPNACPKILIKMDNAVFVIRRIEMAVKVRI